VTNLLHKNDKFVAFHNKYSKNPPPIAKTLATFVPKWRVVRLSWSLRFFMPAAASKMLPAIRFLYPALFYELCSFSDPTNKKITELGVKIQGAISQ